MTPTHARVMAAYGALDERTHARALRPAHRRGTQARPWRVLRSIHETFDHLIHGDMSWMGRFTGGPMPGKRIGETAHEIEEELARLGALDRRMKAWAADVTEQWLAETMS